MNVVAYILNCNFRSPAMQGVSRGWSRETQAGSGAGGYEGDEDVVGVAVQVLAGPT